MTRFAILLVALMVSAPVRGDDILFAGAATADLTPGEGVSLDGPISKPGPALGVHDPLKSRAIVLRLRDTKVLLVINDLCMVDREVFDAAKTLVFEKTGIPVAHQLMAATHTHAAPRVSRISTRPPDEQYRTFVAQRIADAAARANENLAPATIGLGTFELPNLAACRRSLCKPETVAVNPYGERGERVKSVAGKGEVLRPAGPVDPEFSLLSIRHTDGSALAVLGNFSVHYCGGYERGLVSADYFGYYARRLESRLKSNRPGQPFVGIMSNATSGDIGSFRRIETPKQSSGAWSRMEYFGNFLADRTLQELDKLQHSTPQVLAVRTSELLLKVRKPDRARIQWARTLLDDPKRDAPHRWSRIYAQETLHLEKFPDRYAVPLQVIRIGDVALTAAPCEVFAATGLKLKAESPFEHTLNLELANGYSGYLPDRQQHEWGGYETWPARSSRLEVDAEEKIRKELLRLLKQAYQPVTVQ